MCGQILFTRDSPRSSRRCWPLHCNEDLGESAHCCSCAICEHSKWLYELIHRATHQSSRVPGLVSRAYERGAGSEAGRGGRTLDELGGCVALGNCEALGGGQMAPPPLINR